MMRIINIAFCCFLLSCSKEERKQIIVEPHKTAPVEASPKEDTSWSVYFSPNGEATAAIVADIHSARESIYVQAYSFTSIPITHALIEAKNKGVKVHLLLDKSNIDGKGSQYKVLLQHGLKTCIDDKHAIAHNKVIIIDGKKVLTGSFNFTGAAEKNNAENSLHITDAKLAKKYMENWERHLEHSNCQIR